MILRLCPLWILEERIQFVPQLDYALIFREHNVNQIQCLDPVVSRRCCFPLRHKRREQSNFRIPFFFSILPPKRDADRDDRSKEDCKYFGGHISEASRN